MFDDTAPKLDDIDALGDQIGRIASSLAVGTHRLLTAISRFDAAEGWAKQGALSCGQWLSWKVGMGKGEAREKVRVARALRELPEIDAAFARGGLSYSKVRAVTRVATADNEALLLDIARHTTGQQLERVCRKFRNVVREPKTIEAAEEARFLSHHWTDEGMLSVSIQLPADEGARFLSAIDAAKADDGGGATSPEATAAAEGGGATGNDAAKAAKGGGATRADAAKAAEGGGATCADAAKGGGATGAGTTTADNGGNANCADVAKATDGGHATGAGTTTADNGGGATHADATKAGDGGGATGADALMTIIESFLASGPSPRAGGAPHDVVVHVTAEALEAETDGAFIESHDGPGVSAETARRLSCDAAVTEVVRDRRGAVLDVGRKTRTVPAAMRRALEVRDAHCCTFPGCTRTRYLDAHHAVHWADGGETKLDGLVLTCRAHHTFLHEHGWRVEVGTDGRHRWFDADGRPVESAPSMPSDRQDTERWRHVTIDDDVSAETLTMQGWFEKIDTVEVIDALAEVSGPSDGDAEVSAPPGGDALAAVSGPPDDDALAAVSAPPDGDVLAAVSGPPESDGDGGRPETP